MVISCDRDKVSGKKATSLTPEQSKMAEERVKAIEAAKRTIVAKVNGADISMNDLIKEMNVTAPQYMTPGQKVDPQVDAKVRKEALNKLIYRELALQEAVRQKMKVPPEAVEDELKKIKADLKSEAAYQEKLARTGTTEEALKRQLEKNLLLDMITEKEIFEKVRIDPKLVEKTYAKEKGLYKGPSGQMSFEEARPLIEKKLMASAVGKREDEWVTGLKKAAKIEITLDQSAKEIRSVH
jgi:hypothetical protein